jgi:hypothetical protein
MTKICAACKEVKELTEFPPSKGIAHNHSRCRPCKQAYDREYHANRPTAKVARKVELQSIRIKLFSQLIWDYKLSHPCIDCGNSNPIVLEFDHRDGTIKEADVCKLVRGGYTSERIMAEIEKCDVRCANCHRIRTHKQFGWFNGSEEES